MQAEVETKMGPISQSRIVNAAGLLSETQFRLD